MKAKYFLFSAMTLISVSAVAQETYQDVKMIGNDLNGTARYVGMGGAMEALGADISTISSNPAGIGLFRKNHVSLSGGLVMQGDADTQLSYNNTEINIKGNKTNASFDQIGLVYVMNNKGDKSFLNLGFNYHKSRNFDQILTAAASLNGNASQNKNTAMKYLYALDLQQRFGNTAADMIWNGVDANYGNLLSKSPDGSSMDYLNGEEYLFGQYQKGYIGEYDFNISGNINDRIFLGITFGFHDVNYKSNSFYTENLETNVYASAWEQLKITGSGFDLKVGAIFRPIETSPFRIGLYLNTPVFYDLTMSGASDVEMGYLDGSSSPSSNGNISGYDFKIFTPWKFGLSLGHTVGNYLALGATYEYSDYGSIDNRINDGGYYDSWYDTYYESSSSDGKMNDHTKETLKGVSTIKLGLEYKPTTAIALRLGYNYVSSIFNKDGFRDGSIISPGTAYATSTDYTNWKATNRITCGLGYYIGSFSMDLAYQYSATDGDFYPFMSYVNSANTSENNIPDVSKVSYKRHQLLFTFGYRF